jgi:hypothetical protein
MRPLIVVSAGFPTYGDHMGLAYARPLEAAGALPLQEAWNDDAAMLRVLEELVSATARRRAPRAAA